MNVKYSIVIIGLIVFFSSLCFAGTVEEQRQRAKKLHANLPKITASKAYMLFKLGKLFIIDAGQPDRYKRQHCLRAINIPEQFAHKVKLKIPTTSFIGVY